MKENDFKASRLYYYAQDFYKRAMKEEELEKINLTDDFYNELKKMIIEGEIIIININAKMRLGKSTVAIALGKQVFNMLKEVGHKREDEKFSIKNIARDHQEHSEMMRDPNLFQDIIVIDESNELENTGENSSIEQALRKTMSDVHAGRYVHGIYCSPKEIVDDNADIMLNLVSMNKKKRTTRAKVFYRFHHSVHTVTQLIGYVDIYVGDLIEHWEADVKKVFLNPKKTKEEERLIQEWRSKDVYVEYMIKKYEKMELITKEGVLRPRMLRYANVILDVFKRLERITKIHGIINTGLVKGFVKKKASEEKMALSIIGEDLMTKEIIGMLSISENIHKVGKKLDINRAKFMDGKIDKEEYEKNRLEFVMILEELNVIKDEQVKEMERYQDINERYKK